MELNGDSSDPTVPGVQGVNTGEDGNGLLGIGQGNGVLGRSKGSHGFSGVRGESNGGPGVSGASVGSVGVDAKTETGPAAVRAISAGNGPGVFGTGPHVGVLGTSTGTEGFSGVRGESNGGPGVSGASVGSVGVDAKTETGPAALRAIHAGNGLAGDFRGNVHITGKLIVDGEVSARAMPGMGIAVVNASQGDFPLSSFHDVTALRLLFRENGRYVVFARVVIRNNDGDPQEASAKISDGNGFVMDRVDLRIPGSSSMAISLQGTVDISGTNTVGLSCATFAGDAFSSSIFAVQVSNLKNGSF
jgi:hypothetical protein